MSKIPTEFTAKQFAAYIEPYLSQPKRGFGCQIPLVRVFNYILYWLHTGGQWEELPIAQQPGSEKKKSASVPFFITFLNGVMMAVF